MKRYVFTPWQRFRMWWAIGEDSFGELIEAATFALLFLVVLSAFLILAGMV